MAQIKLLTDLRHNNEHYDAGQTLDCKAENITPKQVKQLTESGAIEVLAAVKAVKPKAEN